MNRFLCLFFLLLVSYSASTQITDEEVILQLGDRSFLKEEFSYLYNKNNKQVREDSERMDPEEYMELFINFKLKVLEAERLGYDTLPGFIREMANYREELAKPYLTAIEYSNQMVESAYKRMLTEVRASHILLQLAPNASPADTIKAWNKLVEIRNEVLNGADFNELAVANSQDPSAKQNRGDLGYFSAFQMVYPFEDAAYRLDLGAISMPVRTNFGYHLIFVSNKRPAKGEVKVAHIMKRLRPNASEEHIKRAKQELDSLAIAIQDGADFAELAQTYSDDQRSAAKGGELPWFGYSGMMPAEFAEAAFALTKDGAISPVIKTPYGMHLIKRISHRPIPSLKDMRDFIVDKIRKNPEISRHSQEEFIKELKKTYQLKSNDSIVAQTLKEAMNAFANGQLKLTPPQHPNQVLFHFADQSQRKSDFWKWLRVSTKSQSKNPTIQDIENHYNSFVAQSLTNYEKAHLEEKHPDFKYLLQEYHDGILLFNISEDKIWQAAVNDTIGLQSFYQKNKKNYNWGERFQGWSIRCQNQEVRDFIDAVFDEDPDIRYHELHDVLKAHFEEGEAALSHGYFEKGQDPLIDYLVWNKPKPDDHQDGLDYVRGNKIAPQPKSLNEAKGLHVADYQNHLEKEWLKSLRKAYRVKVKKKVLREVESLK